jgi:hypothetical protein
MFHSLREEPGGLTLSENTRAREDATRALAEIPCRSDEEFVHRAAYILEFADGDEFGEFDEIHAVNAMKAYLEQSSSVRRGRRASCQGKQSGCRGDSGGRPVLTAEQPGAHRVGLCWRVALPPTHAPPAPRDRAFPRPCGALFVEPTALSSDGP